MGKAIKKNPERVRARYSKEFKLEAVRLLKLGHKPATQLARELGIARNQLYKWADELESKAGNTEAAFNGPQGRPTANQMSEVARLKNELAKVTEERDILKKAASYFAKQLP